MGRNDDDSNKRPPPIPEGNRGRKKKQKQEPVEPLDPEESAIAVENVLAGLGLNEEDICERKQFSVDSLSKQANLGHFKKYIKLVNVKFLEKLLNADKSEIPSWVLEELERDTFVKKTKGSSFTFSCEKTVSNLADLAVNGTEESKRYAMAAICKSMNYERVPPIMKAALVRFDKRNKGDAPKKKGKKKGRKPKKDARLKSLNRKTFTQSRGDWKAIVQGKDFPEHPTEPPPTEAE